MISVLQTSTKTAAELNAEAAIAVSPHAIRMRGMVGNTADLENRQQHQQLRTLEGQPAIIRTGEVRPVHSHNVYQYGYGATVYSNTQMVEATTGFAVTPRLVGQQVVLDVAPGRTAFARTANSTPNRRRPRYAPIWANGSKSPATSTTKIAKVAASIASTTLAGTTGCGY